MSLINQVFSSSSHSFSPMPSMSIAPRETKCFSNSKSCAGQAWDWYRWSSPDPGVGLTGLRHCGHVSGIEKIFSSPVRRSTKGPHHLRDDLPRPLHHHPVADRAGPCGGCRLRCAGSPFFTVAPPTSTGSRMAYGFRLPVRPTLTPIFSSWVTAWVAGNL